MPYVFRHGYARITTREFPHSEILGSKVGQHLPQAYRSRPRPSSALGAKASTVCPYSLDRKEHVLMSLWSFQGARGPTAHLLKHRTPAWTAGTRSLKTQQRADEVDVVPGEPSHRTISPKGDHQRAGRLPEQGSGLPRKEVIQPQLPLRLPCYDFTPIIDPTFDGCLPEGLAHRLRVLPTFVV